MKSSTTLLMLIVGFSLALTAFITIHKTPMDAACNDARVIQTIEQYEALGYVVVSETEHPYRSPISTSGISRWGYCRFYMIDENTGVPVVIYANISWDAKIESYFCTGCKVRKI